MKALLTLTLAATLFSANAAAATAAATPAAKPDLAKGQATATQICAACHTNDGSRGSPANPIIAGQHADYLAKQLHDFKTGKRKSAIMAGFAGGLSDGQIRDVTAFYVSKSAKPGFAKDADLAKLGEKIYRGGLADRAVPACAGCHAPNGVGLPVQYPRVAGQHADYTEAQLVAFRGGARGNNAAMAQIAARLSDREIKALAEFIAGLR